MNNEPMKKKTNDVNECTSRGICSTSPILSSLQELIILFIEQSAYYILNLKKFGVCNEPLILSILSDISSLLSINEFSSNQLYEIALKDFSILNSLKDKYTNVCEINKKTVKLIKLPVDFSKDTSLAKSISLGEKVFLNKYKSSNSQVRKYSEMLFLIIKCLSYNILKLKEFSKFDLPGSYLIFKALNLSNASTNTGIERICTYISKLVKYDYQIKIFIVDEMFKYFGDISTKDVSCSIKSGKSILVSGNNFFDLKKVLDKTKNMDINVYTHSNLLVAHALELFQNYENLVGHYGSSNENSIVDFAMFQGAILLAGTYKNSSNYLYRGKIFSNDYIIHSGITRIENEDYSPLISSAKCSKGFKRDQEKEKIQIGFDKVEIVNKFKIIAHKLNSDEINHIYVIWSNATSEIQKEYFAQFFSLLDENEYVITFSANYIHNNVININVGNFLPLLTYTLDIFKKIYPLDKKITFIIGNCDVMTISSILMLSTIGAKSIYVSNCPPHIINPAIYGLLKSKYKVNELSNPVQDLKSMRMQK